MNMEEDEHQKHKQKRQKSEKKRQKSARKSKRPDTTKEKSKRSKDHVEIRPSTSMTNKTKSKKDSKRDKSKKRHRPEKDLLDTDEMSLNIKQVKERSSSSKSSRKKKKSQEKTLEGTPKKKKKKREKSMEKSLERPKSDRKKRQKSTEKTRDALDRPKSKRSSKRQKSQEKLFGKEIVEERSSSKYKKERKTGTNPISLKTKVRFSKGSHFEASNVSWKGYEHLAILKEKKMYICNLSDCSVSSLKKPSKSVSLIAMHPKERYLAYYNASKSDVVIMYYPENKEPLKKAVHHLRFENKEGKADPAPVFMSWINIETIGIVTPVAVYHLKIETVLSATSVMTEKVSRKDSTVEEAKLLKRKYVRMFELDKLLRFNHHYEILNYVTDKLLTKMYVVVYIRNKDGTEQFMSQQFTLYDKKSKVFTFGGGNYARFRNQKYEDYLFVGATMNQIKIKPCAFGNEHCQLAKSKDNFKLKTLKKAPLYEQRIVNVLPMPSYGLGIVLFRHGPFVIFDMESAKVAYQGSIREKVDANVIAAQPSHHTNSSIYVMTENGRILNLTLNLTPFIKYLRSNVFSLPHLPKTLAARMNFPKGETLSSSYNMAKAKNIQHFMSIERERVALKEKRELRAKKKAEEEARKAAEAERKRLEEIEKQKRFEEEMAERKRMEAEERERQAELAKRRALEEKKRQEREKELQKEQEREQLKKENQRIAQQAALAAEKRRMKLKKQFDAMVDFCREVSQNCVKKAYLAIDDLEAEAIERAKRDNMKRIIKQRLIEPKKERIKLKIENFKKIKLEMEQKKRKAYLTPLMKLKEAYLSINFPLLMKVFTRNRQTSPMLPAPLNSPRGATFPSSSSPLQSPRRLGIIYGTHINDQLSEQFELLENVCEAFIPVLQLELEMPDEFYGSIKRLFKHMAIWMYDEGTHLALRTQMWKLLKPHANLYNDVYRILKLKRNSKSLSFLFLQAPSVEAIEKRAESKFSGRHHTSPLPQLKYQSPSSMALQPIIKKAVFNEATAIYQSSLARQKQKTLAERRRQAATNQHSSEIEELMRLNHDLTEKQTRAIVHANSWMNATRKKLNQ
mmetsp:Transcript_51/g.90  ORF Transcript_51/g.90 Transcript_51/m.90 type:complete len:1077 (+) Transcript_51:3-3233(+)